MYYLVSHINKEKHFSTDFILLFLGGGGIKEQKRKEYNNKTCFSQIINTREKTNQIRHTKWITRRQTCPLRASVGLLVGNKIVLVLVIVFIFSPFVKINCLPLGFTYFSSQLKKKKDCSYSCMKKKKKKTPDFFIFFFFFNIHTFSRWEKNRRSLERSCWQNTFCYQLSSQKHGKKTI